MQAEKCNKGISERFKHVRKELSKTQADFARALGLSSQADISKIESGQKQLDARTMTCLSRIFKININWILTGTGSMWIHGEPGDDNVVGGDFSCIPLVKAQLSAGDGSLVVSDEFSGSCAFRTEWLLNKVGPPDGKYLLGVIGDSMSPTIENGDTVMIDTLSTHIYDGNIYALRMDNTIMIKRMALLPGDKVRLISDNKHEYDPVDANRKDVHVIGRVVWFARTMVKTD